MRARCAATAAGVSRRRRRADAGFGEEVSEELLVGRRGAARVVGKGVEVGEIGHFLSGRPQPHRHLMGDDSAVGPAEEVVGPAGLHAPDPLHVLVGDLGDIPRQRLVTAEPTGLEREHGLLGIEMLGERDERNPEAEPTVDAEQRGAGAGGANRQHGSAP